MHRKGRGLPERVSTLVEVAGSQRALARIAGVKDGTVIGWLGGSQPYQSTLMELAERTGVSIDWLRDGTGDTDQEIEKFRARLAGGRLQGAAEFCVVREEPPEMITPETYAGGGSMDATALDIVMDHLTSEETAHLLSRVLGNALLPEHQRHDLARRLTSKLNRKLERKNP